MVLLCCAAKKKKPQDNRFLGELDQNALDFATGWVKKKSVLCTKAHETAKAKKKMKKKSGAKREKRSQSLINRKKK